MKDKAADFQAMKQTLKAGGVKIVTAPQLFPTPPELAARMVELAEIQDGDKILEPSAGTGNILRALPRTNAVIAVEVNSALSLGLSGFPVSVRCRDFLTCTPEDLGTFERVIMNPPFVNGSDMIHIFHALRFVKPGGVLVAICANGPRQAAKLQPLADSWEALPAGTFESSGTNVNTALLTIKK